MLSCATSLNVTTMPCRALEPLNAAAFDRIRRKMVLSHCKWDPQVGDVSTLAPFPLAITRSTWRQLANWAEALAAEAAAAEAELLARPELHRALGLPRGIRDLLKRAKRFTPGIARVIRFDFHPTADGWRISEANSDVPGGFTESSSFTQLMAEHYPQASPAENPTERWADAMAAGVGSSARVRLLIAPGYMEDQQVVQYLAQVLRQRGMEAEIRGPGRALSRFDAIVRFYQGEWLARLPKRLGWPQLFTEGDEPVCNPGTALLTESKRFPLVWDSLCTSLHECEADFRGTGASPVDESRTHRNACVWKKSAAIPALPLRTRCQPQDPIPHGRGARATKSSLGALPTWRQLLPETRDPREVNWASDPSWVLKAAFCNNGDEVAIRSAPPPAQWRKAARSARWNPSGWVTQRCFQPVAIETPMGPMQPCLGVYTIDGKAAGIYGRMTAGAVIDYSAIDVAVLVNGHGTEGGAP